MAGTLTTGRGGRKKVRSMLSRQLKHARKTGKGIAYEGARQHLETSAHNLTKRSQSRIYRKGQQGRLTKLINKKIKKAPSRF